jgi:hypothetical protein
MGQTRFPTFQRAVFSIHPRSHKAQYTAKTHTLGSRCGGGSRSDDGRLDVKILGS